MGLVVGSMGSDTGIEGFVDGLLEVLGKFEIDLMKMFGDCSNADFS